MKPYILFLLLTPILSAQEIVEQSTNNQAKEIINKYFEVIGGIKKIKKIQTLEKKFEVEISGVPNLYIMGRMLYKTPRFFVSETVKTVGDVSQIHTLKYNNQDCVLSKSYEKNGEYNTSQTKIEGELLDEKMKNFIPFPLLEALENNTSFSFIGTTKHQNKELQKIHMIENNIQDTTFFFFDTKTHYLVRKEIRGPKTNKITEYTEYQKINGIYFPFIEKSIIEIDEKPAQESLNKVLKIEMNMEIDITEFE